ncbi:glycosyl hydrolase family 99 [Aquimarina sp. MAR_2010_214]|uniref:glycoside hydrolase family 71/99-like protein n=1 Tax=Aquimarina sp. MAR_2010_214 TaxID=1250026 RepID=UPI000C704C13|nr:glycoside hydrolase family 71/99-like protein [Aquimarina sp. MAR_2010_214]PKV52476.1 glycosyl hydrolase family 99 [Aquimarina sp. MAR_2010_214]
MLRSSNTFIFFIFLFIVFFYSCEKEDITLIDQQQIDEQSAAEVVQDTTYTDAELLKVLEEEKEFIKLEKEGYIVDISGMDVVKENPKKVYVHYLPWFQNKDFDGYWGQHWTMSNQDPEIIDENGNRQIASYYYPLIGPYSSGDPDLHEYHFLMMKLSGIDGVIFDWYGSRDLHDYGLIKQSTETFINSLEDLGLEFSIMYEDRVATQATGQSIIEAAQEDFTYINDSYFSSPKYMQYNGKNMLFVFGPHYLTTATEWNQVFDVLPTENRPSFLTLWAASNRVGVNASGEFLWVDKDHLLAHQNYYDTYQASNPITVGSSYPGFKSFYTEGGWSNGSNDWTIDFNSGHTFVETLNYTHHELSDFIQIITWNDFGEGTMIEPTQEFGFTYLQLLQQYTGVSFSPNDLQVALDLYHIRKEYKKDAEVQKILNRSYKYIKRLRLQRADKVLKAIKRFY